VIVITKRGKPLAQITPYRTSCITPKPGRLSDTLVFEKDVISPVCNFSMGILQTP
jgi:antitoxin (DNA-binding transcriptional repressor) of toxin-antitoxin stability system